MLYKNPDCQDQLLHSPEKLQEIALYFEELSLEFGINPVVTRVWDAVCGDSGVHEAHRAIDFRDETRPLPNKSEFLYTSEQVDSIVKAMNDKYPRTDGKLVCMHHSFQGAPMHFHLQIQMNWI